MKYRIEIFKINDWGTLLYSVELKFPGINEALAFSKGIIDEGQGFRLIEK